MALGSSLFAGVISTDGTRYATNHDVTIDGAAFEVKEAVTLQVTYLDGTALAGAAGDPWVVEATPQGEFLTTWTTPLLDTATMLLLTAVGNTTGDTSTASFAYAPPAVNLDQLKNGDDPTPLDPGEWVNGNLNTSNSHYVEAWSAGYRAVMTDMPIGDTVTITLGYDIKHSDKHALDYLTHYDRIDDPTGTHLSTYGHSQETIDPTDGVAGVVDGSSPLDQTAIPVPTVNMTVMGNPQPSTSFNALPASDRLMSLWGGTFVGGTPISYPTPGPGESDLSASNSSTLIDVTFVVDSSTMILAWGGHIGSRNDWGYTLAVPNSAGGISGSPYHMRVEDWNLGNIGNQDRSLSADGVAAPPPPECNLSVDTIDVCAGTDTCVFVVATLGNPPFTYSWTGPNSFSSSNDTVCFVNLQAADAGTYTVTVTDTLGLQCESDLVVIVNTPPVAICPGDQNLFVCDLSAICLSGFGWTDYDGDAPSYSLNTGTLSGDTVCFTPVEGPNVIQLIVWDACGADTCQVTVNVTLNSPPVATCAGNQSLGVCDLSEICLPGFGATDSDGNLQSVSVSGGTLSGDTVCFTPVVGANVITLIATDSCGAADTCTTTVTVAVNAPPSASCPGDASFTLCSAEQICVGPFSSSDPDGNLSSTSFSFGTPSNDSVCFTPDTAGVYSIIYDVVDACGASASCTTNVTVSYIAAPTISDAVHNFGTCGPGEVCVSLPAASGGAPPYTYTVDGVAKTDTVCYALSNDTTIVAQVIVTDSCGRADTASLTINAAVNTAPVISAVDNIAQFVCNSGDTVCLKVTVTDPDNGLSGTSQLGWYNAADSTVCFVVDTAGSYCDQLIITDSCGLADTSNFCVAVSVNAAPICTAPNDTALFVCDLSDICLPGFGCSDADGNLASS
ncbi:MAG TPA: hypothetical protein VLB27_03125, partial [candidate division Zixibacteria bacterium]|nr:hypothetical protein [candidate division Zixibacteria bacterium]